MLMQHRMLTEHGKCIAMQSFRDFVSRSGTSHISGALALDKKTIYLVEKQKGGSTNALGGRIIVS